MARIDSGDPWVLNDIHTAYVQEGRSILDCTWVVPCSDKTIAKVVREMGWSRPRAGYAPATERRSARNEPPVSSAGGTGARPVIAPRSHRRHRRRGRL